MIRLSINVDHVATVREARRTDEPDPVRAALLAEMAGADGITVHLREDRRHIQERDVELLLGTIRTGLNLELAAEEEVLALAETWRPMQATLVPERREEITTEGGLDLGKDHDGRVGEAVVRLREAGMRVSLFIDPEASAVDRAIALEPDAVELHTGEYANAETRADRERQLGRLREAASRAREGELDVHAGHGLTYRNVGPIAALPECEEVSIGHSVVSRSVLVGMERAVRELRERIVEARREGAGGGVADGAG